MYLFDSQKTAHIIIPLISHLNNIKMSSKNTSMKKVKPLGDRVILQEYKEKVQNNSGIILPDTVNSDKDTKKGKVVAVGPGKYENGKLVPVSIKVGDIVLYGWGDNIKIDGQDYIVVRESDISAIIG